MARDGEHLTEQALDQVLSSPDLEAAASTGEDIQRDLAGYLQGLMLEKGIACTYDEHASRDTHTWGTTGYSAPEQLGFDQSDARTDVFALGCSTGSC